MRGSYLGAMASLEDQISEVIGRFLDISHERDLYFGSRITSSMNLLTKIDALREIVDTVDGFDDLPKRLHAAREFRNICAHAPQWASIGGIGGERVLQPYLRQLKGGKEKRTGITIELFQEKIDEAAALYKVLFDLYQAVDE